ncbi:stalk domain-containing protein [Chengkuizengella axinellae]|uniref:Stalk domain-containing protein n=1 Tax=Chengkuizengella axinellae TaxID=3064388 RepID=A0ABT9J5N4_9BACL|nr:stalk domain-containing protein [Chengkuizengella sp. 2205SS18-9]MDP5276315.1 stalk domain-containing protein [Chengkuizengella sp. 2205SS18-9]
MKHAKLFSITLLGTLLTIGNSTYANTGNINPISNLNEEDFQIELYTTQNMPYKVEVNGSFLSNEATPYLNKNNILMIPLRAVATALDYEVIWDDQLKTVELLKENNKLELIIDQEIQNFSYEFRSGIVYVDIDYIKSKLLASLSISDTGIVSIQEVDQDSEQDVNTETGVITSISTQNDQTTLVEINGFEYGVSLVISDQTQIISEDGKRLTINDLSLGAEIQVEHDLIMTMSIPPMTNAQKIIVNGTVIDQQQGTVGTISEMKIVDEVPQFTVLGQKIGEHGYDEIKLNISETTVIINLEDQKELSFDELSEGTKVYAFFGPRVTKSLPPIGTADVILIER